MKLRITMTVRLLILALLLAGSALSLTSCEDPNADPSKGLSDEIQGVMPQAALDDLKAKGMIINEGKQPPNVEGIFLANPLRLLSPFGPADTWSKGRIFLDLKYRFYQQADDVLKVDYKAVGPGASTTGTGEGAFMSGFGNKFTLFIASAANTNGIDYKAVNVISGEISPDGIVNFQQSLCITEKTGDPNNVYLLPVNQTRVFEDGNQLASKTSTY